MSQSRLRTFIAYVEDLPGVLNRVASLFRRRSYNIDSLTVGRTHEPGVSRMTDRRRGRRRRPRAASRPTSTSWSTSSASTTSTQARDGRARARAHQGARRRRPRGRACMQLCEVFRARVVDVGPEALIVEITGDRRQDRRPRRRARALRHRRDGPHRRGRDGAQRRGLRPRQRPAAERPGERRRRLRPPRLIRTRRNKTMAKIYYDKTPTSPSSAARRSPSSATARRATPTR